MKDILSSEEIIKNLSALQNPNIKVFDEIDSTNVHLKNLAKNGEKIGTIVISDHQTAGHGRFQRKFHSPNQCGIYMSILLKPDLPAEQSVMLTAAAAVAVSDSISVLTSLNPKIKWVNDILIDDKKVCGILTEGAINPKTLKFDWAIVGIGINVYVPNNDFDPEIKSIATALLNQRKENFRNKLCAEIVNRLLDFSENFQNKDFISKYKEYSCVLNKKINVLRNDKIYPATALEIDDDCRLKVEFEDGKIEFLNSGEISIKL